MVRIGVVLAFGATLAATSGAAQELYRVRRTAGYGALGIGSGTFELTCAAGCPGELSAGAYNFHLGRHFSQRWRLELAASMQQGKGDGSSSAMTASGGVAVYLISGLHIRGAASYMRVDTDSVSTLEASGGPGYLVGAGFDLHIARTLALTPYVNYGSGTIRATGSNTDVQVKTLNFGVNVSSLRARYSICRTASGERFRSRGGTAAERRGFATCAEEVRQRVRRESRERLRENP